MSNELILLKGLLEDLTICFKKYDECHQGTNPQEFSILIADMCNKIEKLNKFFMENMENFV
jgi:hypothetical protein